MNTDHTQIIMWVVGTGIGILIAFVTILSVAIGKKVDSIMCNKIHEMLNEKLTEMSSSVKDGSNKIIELLERFHNMDNKISELKGMLQGEIDIEATRWGKTDKKE